MGPTFAGRMDESEADTPDDVGEEAQELRSFIAGPAEHGLRLDRALAQYATEFSRSYLQSLIAAGHVRVDEQSATVPSRKLRAGQRVQVSLVPTLESRAFRAEAIPLKIVFEDDHVLVIDKPAGLVVHPAPGNWSGTLLNALLAHHAAAATLARAGIVHRLDKDTSGLMVVAKSLQAFTGLVRSIAERSVKRVYLAIVHGAPPQRLSIEEPIGRDPRSRIRMAVVRDGRAARTDVELLGGDGSHALVRCTLHTGRTHQIRVHLAFHRWPLVADATYGGRPALGLTRQALHAWCLGLSHPVTGERLEFVVPPPADFDVACHLLLGNNASAIIQYPPGFDSLANSRQGGR